jgi:hypothetical protein
MKKRLRKATAAKMLAAATEVVLECRARQGKSGKPEYVLFEFNNGVEFAKDFPAKKRVERTETTAVWKLPATKLLDWLYKHKYSEYDTAMLIRYTTKFEREFRKLERMFED